jgi:hypothetical protein
MVHDKAGVFEDLEMLGHGWTTDGMAVRQFADRRGMLEKVFEEASPCGVPHSVEDRLTVSLHLP